MKGCLRKFIICCALIRNMESQDFAASRNYEDSGPITISDLRNSVPNISASKKKKNFKRQKPHRDKEATADLFTATDQQDPNTHSSIEEPILNRLRSRLDPTYNTTNASSHPVVVDSDSLPESSIPAVDKPVKRMKKKQRKRSRDRDTNDQPTGVDFTATETQLENSVTQDPVQAVGRNDDRMLLSSPLRQLPELDTGDIHQEHVERFQPRQYPDPDDPHLLVSQEDIIQEDHHKDTIDDTVPQDQPMIIERPTTVFVEQKGKQGFTAYKRDDLNAVPLDNQKDSVLPSPIMSTSQLCVYVHAIITKISNISHGLLAGISLWECIVVNLLAKEEPTQVLLLQFYSLLSLPSHFVHLFLLSITITSLLDRLDIAKINKACVDIFLKSPQHMSIILSLAVVLVGFVLTLSIVAIDDRISLFLDAPNEWLDVLTTFNTSESTPSSIAFYASNGTVYVPSGSTSSRLNSWLAINIVRAICYNISWMLSVWQNSYNRLEERLKV